MKSISMSTNLILSWSSQPATPTATRDGDSTHASVKRMSSTASTPSASGGQQLPSEPPSLSSLHSMPTGTVTSSGVGKQQQPQQQAQQAGKRLSTFSVGGVGAPRCVRLGRMCTYSWGVA